MNSTIAKFISRTIYSFLLLLAVLTIFLSIFLSQLELENYRYKLEQELSATLEQPVQIGYCKLTFAGGIALRFQDMLIGSVKTPLAVVPQLTATLKIAPLFKGQIFFDQVKVNSPDLQFWLPLPEQPAQTANDKPTNLFGISVLTIKDASVKIHQRLQEGSHELLNLDSLAIELRDWQSNQTAKLLVSGELQQAQKPARFLLDIDLPSSTNPAVWRQEQLKSQLSITNLATSTLAAFGATGLPSSINLIASLKGIPAQGAQINAELTDSNGEQNLANLAGTWTSSPEQESIAALNGDLLGLPLKGEFFLLRQEQQQVIAGRFGATDINLSREILERWNLPATDNLLSAKLNRLELVLDKNATTEQATTGLPRISAELSISELKWKEKSPRQVQNFSANLALVNQHLTLQKGKLVVGQQPLFFSGHIESLFDNPQLDLDINLQGQLSTLFKQDELPSDWKLTGEFPIKLSLSGPLPSPQFKLHADLTKSRLSLDNLLQKQTAQKSSLLLEGIIDSEQAQLDHLELRLPGLTITGNGCFSHDPKSDFFLLDIDPINLARLQPLSPLLKKLQLHGTLHPTLERSPDGLKSTLQLVNVGAHLNNIVGDLNRTTGNIDITRSGLLFENLGASFGKSVFVLDGQVDNWQHAQLDLKIRSKKLRAQDLIFPNRELQLYDLNGQLQINDKGINFKQIRVQLEQDTQVVVNGSLDSFSAPQITLDIEAEKANIDQVIQLFSGPPKVSPKAQNPNANPLLITARVNQGTIGALRFQNAVGSIKDHHRVFTIYPLRFQSNKGFCLARVEFNHNRPGGLLKVSGHLENFDASILHQEIYNRRGLISGPLRGDFYLEGSLAENKFWHHVAGGAHLQVTKGTLRKFSGLASVFSLLNISQLFAGNLPDMDKEGMPFTLIEGSLKFADGWVATEDLRIYSVAMNMALIGKQSLTEDNVDYDLAVMPLRTVDKVITAIPVAGWVLAGDNKALLTAHFKIEGPGTDPKVTAVPVGSISQTVFGIIKRTLGLPAKLIKDVGSLLESKPKKKLEATE